VRRGALSAGCHPVADVLNYFFAAATLIFVVFTTLPPIAKVAT
jgi:hypothetical protein